MGRTGRIRKKCTCSKKAKKVSYLEEFSKLCIWMSESGWKPVARISLAVFPETGRGLMAVKTIETGGLIVQIPEKLLITRARVFEEIPELSKELTTAELLTLYLLHCLKCNISEAYLKTLPREYSIGGLCTDQEIFLLPEIIREKIIGSKKYMYRKFEKLKNVAGLKESMETFLWAWCSVNTRAVYLNDGGFAPEGNMALAPYLDLLNHDSKAAIEAGFNSETRCYEIRTKEKIKKFEQIFINYGPHDNLKLFLEYGFLIPSNVHSVVEFDQEDLFQLLKNQNTEKGKMLISELSRNFYCNWDGLSWNVQVALTLISCESFRNIKSPYDVVPKMNPKVKTLARCLIKNKIDQLSPREPSSILNPSPSFLIAQSLINDFLHLLKHTLSTLDGEME